MLAQCKHYKLRVSIKMKDEKKSKAAQARAESLTPSRRKEIARDAALKRWGNKATHTGELKIGNVNILCHVLENGTRVISGNAIQRSLGYPKSASGMTWRNLVDSKLMNFLSEETVDKLENPIKFDRVGKGGSVPDTYGYDAAVLIDICDAILSASKVENLLTKSQQVQAHFAEVLIRSVAKVGLVALIDEATGYQEVRDKKALQAILDKYLAKELAAWAKRFPDDFYKEMFRLRGWKFDPNSVARPGVVGRYTLDLIYERLAPGLLEELEQKNPRNTSGNRMSRHHQWLSSDVGHPALSQHLHAIIGFMKLADSWEQLINMVDKVYPKKGTQINLLYEDS